MVNKNESARQALIAKRTANLAAKKAAAQKKKEELIAKKKIIAEKKAADLRLKKELAKQKSLEQLERKKLQLEEKKMLAQQKMQELEAKKQAKLQEDALKTAIAKSLADQEQTGKTLVDKSSSKNDASPIYKSTANLIKNIVETEHKQFEDINFEDFKTEIQKNISSTDRTNAIKITILVQAKISAILKKNDGIAKQNEYMILSALNYIEQMLKCQMNYQKFNKATNPYIEFQKKSALDLIEITNKTLDNILNAKKKSDITLIELAQINHQSDIMDKREALYYVDSAIAQIKNFASLSPDYKDNYYPMQLELAQNVHREISGAISCSDCKYYE